MKKGENMHLENNVFYQTTPLLQNTNTNPCRNWLENENFDIATREPKIKFRALAIFEISLHIVKMVSL